VIRHTSPAHQSRSFKVNTRKFPARRAVSLLLSLLLYVQLIAPAGLAARAASPGAPRGAVETTPTRATAPAAATLPAEPPTQTGGFGVELTPLNTPFHEHVGVDDHQPTRKLVLTANAPGGEPSNFELVGSDGAHRGFSNVAGLRGELRIATARDDGQGQSLGGFRVGELFTSAGVAAVVARVSPDGSTVQNPWAVLSDQNGSDAGTPSGLHVDRTGVFGGDLLVVTTAGSVWRVNGAGAAARLADLGTRLAGVTTVPDDATKYGPWAGRALVGAPEQGAVYAVDAQGGSAAHALGLNPSDLKVIPAHENFYAPDFGAKKLVGAPAAAFASMIGDVLVAQGAPGLLARVRWDGAQLQVTQLAAAVELKQIAFSPAGIAPIVGVKQVFDKIAVVRHAPAIDSGRVEGSLWQLLGESLLLDGTDTITADLFVPGTPNVTAATSGNGSFGGVIEGPDGAQPSGYSVTIKGSASLRHLITRADPINLENVDAPPAPAGTRDVSLTQAGQTPGDFSTLRNLSLSGQAGAVAVPPGTYGHLSAGGRTALILGVENSEQPSVYNLDELTLSGRSELRLVGPVTLTVRGNVTLTGSTVGAAENPRRLLLKIAQGELRLTGGAVLYGVVRVPQGPVTVEGGSRLRGTVACDRLHVKGNGVLQITENDIPPPPINRPPSVDAGPDQTITLPVDTLSLSGAVSDDGLPAGSSLSTTWRKVSGPGPVSFGDASDPTTAVTFVEPGDYVLELKASDGELFATDTVAVTVVPRNQPPVVDAGPDQTIELPNTAALAGSVSDDALPRGSHLAVQWQKVEGPGEVTFANASLPVTTAAFSAPGAYVLRLTADDSEFSISDTLTVTVHPENQPPVVDAGEPQTIRLPAGANLNGTATDDGWPFGSTLTIEWTQVSGPGAVTFADAHAAATTANFSAPGEYTLRLSANDTRFTVADETTVTVLPANTPPTVDAGPDRATAVPSVPRDRAFQLRAVRPGLQAVGIDYHLPTNGLVLSVNYPSGLPYNFAAVAADGQAAGFSGVSGLNDELKIATARDDTGHGTSLGGFAAGELFSGTGVPGVIMRVSADGSTVQDPWVTLPGESGLLNGSLHVDRTGVFGGDLIAVTNGGGVWRINAAGVPTLVARLNTFLEGLVTVPDDPAKYGPWAGRIVAGNETQGRVFAINAQGHVTSFNLGIRPEDIELIPANQNFFGLDAEGDTLWGAEAAGFQKMVGDFVIAQESPGLLYHVRWNGTTFEKTQLAQVPRWGHLTFAPAGVGEVATTLATAQLAGTAADDGLPAGVPLALKWTQVSGPAAVSFAAAGSAATTAAFHAPGTYVLRLTADDSEFSDADEMTVTVAAPNLGPVVDAGPDQTITLPSGATLNGSASDDGLPAGSTLTTAWTKVSGPGEVTFGDAAATSTSVSFGAPGIYVLRLSATDGDLTATDELKITVKPENHAPVVDAGPDQTITLPAGASLHGTVIDDGIPPETPLTIQWTKVSGPGAVTFADATRPVTTATFGTAGTYVLRLTAGDGEHTVSDEMTVTVNPRINLPPVVDAGPDKVVILPGNTTLAGTATDDGVPEGSTLTVAWSKVSGPGNVTFGSPTSTTTTASFSLAGAYVLRLTASDGALQSSDTVTVTVFPPNNPPVVNAGPDQIITLPNPVSLSATATDDGQPAGSTLSFAWSVVSGPGTVTFAAPNAKATTATFSVDGTYVLRFTASDSLLSASDDLTVVVMPQLIGQLTCTRTSKGTDFWLMFNENLGTPTLSLFITGEFATTGTVSIPGLNFQQNFTVTPGQVATVNIPSTAAVNTNDGIQNKGIHVVAQKEVAVYGLNRVQFTTDAFLGLPTTILGTEYITLGYRNSNIIQGTQFGVVATANATTVTITTPVTTGTHQANVPYTITLNQGQAYQLRNTGASPNDLSGTLISASKPVAVFGSHQCANIPGGVTACDHIVEQIPPPDTWGRNFVTMPLATRRNGDTFRFLASQDNTTIAVNGAVVATLNKGRNHERIINGPATIISDKPILVAQYSNGSSFDGVTSDPFMMLIPPFEQFGGNYTLTTPASGFEINFINVVAPTSAVGQIKLDGVNIPASSFTTIGVSGFSGAQVPITKGTHNLNSTVAPFGAFVYGFASFDSYGYPGSMCLTTAVIGTRLNLTPKAKTNLIGTNDCVTATVTDLNDRPVGGARVEFAVTGVNPTAGSAQTNADGQAQFCYVGANAGADLIVASVTQNIQDSATKQWNPPNQPPVVSAGPDQTVTMPAPLALAGTVTDDGLPAGTLNVTWSVLSGPGAVTFADPSAASTSATFGAPGTYTLRLTATDTELTSTDDCVITVNPVPPNQPPVVSAGPDVTAGIGFNLIQNPGNELPLENGEIPGWTEAEGDSWAQAAAGADGFPESFDGATYFYAGETAAGELRQDVSLAAFASTVAAGTQQFSFRVAVRTRDESPSDVARVLLEYRDATNANLLGTLDSGDVQAASGWVQIEDTRAAPAGTGWIRIRLLAARHTGATNDAYFDGVSLRPVGTAGAVLAGTATDDGLPYGSTLNAAWTKVSGPGEVMFADATRAAASATFTEPGEYVLRLTADDTEDTAADEMTVTVTAPNEAPAVNAGPDQTITLPAGVELSGTAADDGLPLGSTLTTTWSKVNGPGAVTFADPSAPATTATFGAPGTYTLRLTATDGEFTTTDDLIVTARPERVNQAPAVNAGPDQTITLPAGATLNGTATDDGLPEGSTLSLAWSVVSGPSPVTFADPGAASTTATFGGAGTYVLRLSASDSQFTASDDVTVVVNSPQGNQAPRVNAGPDRTITLPTDTVALQGSATDDGLPEGSSLSFNWTKVSGPGVVVFGSAGSATTTASFGTAGRYTLRLTASDSELSGFDDVTVTVIGENRPPTVSAGPDQTITLPGTAALSGTADDDGLPEGSTISLAWSVVSGPGTVGFANSHAAATAASFSTDGLYVLRLTASDGEFSTSDDVAVTVNPRIPPPTVAVSSPADGASITTRTPIVGSVSADSTWRVEYSLNGHEGSGVAPVWVALASGSGPVNNGLLATFDPTLLLNGVYAVRLVATDVAGQTSVSTFSAVVEGEQKLGNFSLTFNDLSVPVAGVPIEVTRTYDSRDKRVGDFGVGWTLGVRSIRVEKNGVIGRHWEETRTGGFLPNYCAQSTRPRIVSVSFPDGRVYKFQAVINPQCQRVYPLQFASVGFVPMPGTQGSLAVEGSSEVFLAGSYPGPVEVLDLDTFDEFDAGLFRLTTEDGTQYVIDQRTGVRSVADTNGNSLVIGPNGITHSSGKSVTFTRDAQGRITRITDPQGNALNYAYDARGDLVSSSDRENQTTTYVYNSTHGLLSLTDPLGNQPARVEYDDAGRVVSQTDATGKTVHFNHDLDSRQEVVTDRLGRITVFEYDARGNILRVTDAAGASFTRTYDGNDNLLSETDANGKTTSYTYDARGNRASVTDPLGNTTRYTYNSLGQVLTVTDPAGRVATNTYDAKGNLTSARDPLGHTAGSTYNSRGLETSTTDALGNTTLFEYDAAGNLTKQTDPAGRATTYTYDAVGRRLTETTTRTAGGAAETLTTAFEYDRAGRLLKTTYPDATTTRASYDAAGRRTESFDRLGRRTAYEYDDMGRPVKTTFPDGTTEEAAYDAEGRRTSSTDRAGRVTAYAYDPLGRLVKTTLPDGEFYTTEYDANGQAVRTVDALGHATLHEYDAAGRRTKVTDALGRSMTFAYDADGNQTALTDARGQTTRFEYDALGRRTRTVYPDATAQSAAYDAAGRIVSRTDQAGRAVLSEYDRLGRLVKVTDALGGVTSLAYDEQGNLLTQTDALNRTTRYEYDRLGRRTRRTLPLGQSETYAYDAAGNVVSRTDFRGKRTAYAFDEMGRLLSRTPDPTLGQPSVTFTYTPTGQRATMTDASGTTTYTYDSRDRLVSKQTPQGTLAYTYDAAGNLLTVRSSNAEGVAADYAYDELNRLASVTDQRGGAGVTAYTYDANGNLESATYPNAVRTAYTYDALNRLTALSAGVGGATVASYAYTLGAAGNRLSVTEQSGRTVNYTYDALYRLTREAVAGDPAAVNGEVAYAYDAVGNRLSRESSLPGVETLFSSYDANDRLRADTYDANGNTVGSNGTAYSYDFENRLTSVAGGVVTYVYDGDGNRVAKTEGGVTTRYLVDTNNHTGHAQVVEELRGGQVARQYTYGHDLVSQRQLVGGQWRSSFYGYDGHGSVRYLTDEQGGVTDTYTYDAFGVLVARTGSTPNDYLYAGEQFDPNVGFYFLRARYMNPQTGRFQTQDTYEGSVFDPQSLHKYLYASANPVGNVDPTGNFSFSIAGFSVSFSIHAVLVNLAVSVLFRALEAAINVSNGMSLGAAVQEAVIGVAFDTTIGLVLGGVLAQAPRLIKIRAAAQSIAAFRAARRASSVWRLNPFARGRAIERFILGRPANIPVSNFPVIDDFANGVATSIKSLDLTADSYQAASALSGKLGEYASKLSTFAGRTWGGFTVQGNQIAQRVLVVAFEQGAPTARQAETLRAFIQTARQNWPNVKVVFQFIE
jgi:RHS repeat-associated protein